MYWVYNGWKDTCFQIDFNNNDFGVMSFKLDFEMNHFYKFLSD